MNQLLALTVTMLVLDAIWLTMGSARSNSLIAAIQGSPLSIRWLPAIITYVVMIAGVYWFAVRSAKTWKDAAVKGAALGAVVYGVYDMTNHATLKNYTLSYAVADWIWGTFLFSASAAAAMLVGS
jgi:uncharacterized membrane protein